MLTGRLNVFQRLARTWDAVHPYNAGQACQLAKTFSRDAIDHSWHAALEELGLGRVRVEGSIQTFFPASPRPVHSLTSEMSLSRHFTVGLNRPFDDPDEPPFRPFVQDVGDSTWIGIVYQHWVADSVSIRMLLRGWVARLLGSSGARSAVKSLPSVSEAEAFTPAIILALLRRYAAYRRSRKVHTMGPLDYPVTVRFPVRPRASVSSVLSYARAHCVTMNDLFLAALAQACDQLVPAQHRPGRRELALSSVVDLRPTLPRNSDQDAFGCHLGFTSIVCRPDHLRDWSRLLRCVSSQTRAQRRAGIPHASVAWMLCAEAAARLTRPDRIYDLYRKEAPFVAGISNVNLKGTWFAANHPGLVLDYIRISPTGPMVPLALNVTSLGEQLRLSLTYRSALFNDWTAAEVVEMFAGSLGKMAATGLASRSA